jgi:glycosyltransferase involved in cell wall biosynthesis
MKIAYITAGAAGMYCGSCLRDNTLASTLLAAGHDVALIPTYTPTRTDETNVSGDRVFLGGINVFLEQHVPVFRRAPEFIHRLLDARPLLSLATRWSVKVDPAELGSLTVSMLKGRDGYQSAEVDTLVRYLRDEVRPDIVNLPNSLLIGLAPAIREAIHVPLCCTLQGEDLFLSSLREPYRSEALRLIRAHARHVDAFVAVSAFCAEAMAPQLELPASKLRIVRLGINTDGYARTTPSSRFTIGYLARIAPEKGLHVLCDAYRRLRAANLIPGSRLVAAGYLGGEHRDYLEQIRRDMDKAGLTEDFQYLGELDRAGKIRFLQGLDLFSVPGPYAETKGLFLLEAMAAGVPVVQPEHGVFPEIIRHTGGGVLVRANDAAALAHAIGQLAADPARRVELGAAAYTGVRRHFTAARMAEEALSVYADLLAATRLSAAGSQGKANA